jgi:hypothetical protein
METALQELGFAHVVYVDDAFDRDPVDRDALKGWLSVVGNRTKVKVALSSQDGCPEPGDDQFEALFATFADDEANSEKLTAIRKAVDAEIDKEADGDDEDEHRRHATDRIIGSTLSEIMNGVQGVSYTPLGLDSWALQKLALVQRAKNERTLFVFDQELSEQQTGDVEIKSLVQSLDNSETVYILLSFKVEHNREHEKTRELQGDGVPATAIPKRGLEATICDGKLSIRIKAAIMAKVADPIHKAFQMAMRASSKSVAKRVESLTGLEFDELVMRSSNREGIHELDTLIRIYTYGFSGELRRLLRGKRSIHSAIEQARKYSVDAKSNTDGIGDVAWKLYREELYDSGEYINDCNAPLDAGDIFQLTGQDGQDLGAFILIAQPCDMMVRTKTGLRKANDLLLAAIKTPETANDLKAKKAFELPFYEETAGKSRLIDFSQVFRIDGRLLDLCCLHSDGVARISASDRPKGLSPGWMKRWDDVLKGFVTDMLESLEAWEKKSAEQRAIGEILPKHVVLLNGQSRIKTTVERQGRKKHVFVGIERTQRLSNAIAAEMLRAFGDYLSRPARPHALADPPKSS